MLSHSQAKQIRSLQQKKYRLLSGLFVVEGRKMVEELLKSAVTCRSVFYTCRQDTASICELALQKGIPCQEISESEMASISSLSTPSPLLATALIPPASPIPLLDPTKLYLALDGVRDPGNLGTILRLADWFGIEAVFLSNDSVELYNPKTIQATMGAVFRTPCHYTSLEDLVKDNTGTIPVYATALKGENIYSFPLTTGGILIMGSESFGIREPLLSLIQTRLYIPSYSRIPDSGSESLNVAIATAIACSAFRRENFISGKTF